MEKYRVITITYKNVSLSELGKFIIPKTDDISQYEDRLKNLKAYFNFEELMYLTTCNRVTYFYTSEKPVDSKFLAKFFQYINPFLKKADIDYISQKSLVFEGEAAVQHLMEVAGSIDSMVLGEREIPKQIRLAYEECHKMGLTGDNIRVVVKTAIQTSKTIFTETAISRKPVSVVSLAIDQLQRKDLPKNTRFLIIGAGTTNNMVAKYLLKNKFENFTVFNRSLENARSLALKLNAPAYSLSQMKNYSGSFDVIVSCTGSTLPIITREIYEHLLNGDKGRKIIVDLAIPYDIERGIVEDYNVDYIEIEQLREIANHNMAFRKNEIKLAKKIIQTDLEEFKVLYRKRQVELAMRDVSVKIREIKDYAVNKVFSKEIEQLDPGSKEVLNKILKYVEKKYISIPITVAKDAFVEK